MWESFFLQLDIRSSSIHFQLASSEQMLKVLAFEAILLTFSRMKLSFKLSLKLVKFKSEKVIILRLLKNVKNFVNASSIESCFCIPTFLHIPAILRVSWRKNTNKIHLFWMSYIECKWKCPYSKKFDLSRKIIGCTSVNLILTFHRNFHPNICIFANLPISRKLPCILKTKNLMSSIVLKEL